MKKQRQEEKEQARKEAKMTGSPLEATGTKKKRGTALIQQRGKGREIKSGKN